MRDECPSVPPILKSPPAPCKTLVQVVAPDLFAPARSPHRRAETPLGQLDIRLSSVEQPHSKRSRFCQTYPRYAQLAADLAGSPTQPARPECVPVYTPPHRSDHRIVAVPRALPQNYVFAP